MHQHGKTTSLLFGIQWDLVLKYLNIKEAKTVSELISDSTSWGNYYNNDSTISITSENAKKSGDNGATWSAISNNTTKSGRLLLTTGSSNSFCALGIYDFAGNEWEITLAHFPSTNSAGYNTNGNVTLRGGGYFWEGYYDTASYHSSLNANYTHYNNGFRVALY